MKYLPVLWQLLYHSVVYVQNCMHGTGSSSLLFCTDSCYLALFEVSVNYKLSYEQRMQCTCVALYQSAQQQSQDKSSECTLLNVVNMSCIPGKFVNISILLDLTASAMLLSSMCGWQLGIAVTQSYKISSYLYPTVNTATQYDTIIHNPCSNAAAA